MNIHERANNLIELMASKGIGSKPIVFVAHSLGGLLVKEMLRSATDADDSEWRKIAENTRLVVFMATPHTGATLASAANALLPRITSKTIELLSNDSGYLTNLNQFYRNFAKNNHTETVAYYEKYKTKGVQIVSAESADPGCCASPPIAIDADHIGICKPNSKNATIYASLKRHVRNVQSKISAQSSNNTSTIDIFSFADYAAGSDFDRRDLLQKLIDAGREHEYQHANDQQNKFAQRYHKLGLHTVARTRSDALLAAVEQRFHTHVYLPKICKGAEDCEITAAVQKDVIDAICHKQDGAGAISPAAILQALYFLTSQCYIRWDPS